MNNGQFNGFRDANPRDVHRSRSILQVRGLYQHRDRASAERSEKASNTVKFMRLGEDVEFFTNPLYSAAQTGFVVNSSNFTVYGNIFAAGSHVTNVATTTDFITWTDLSTTLLSNAADTVSKFIWTGSEYSCAVWSATTNTIIFYTTTNWQSFTNFTVASSVTTSISEINISATKNYYLVATANALNVNVIYRIDKAGAHAVSVLPSYVSVKAAVHGLNFESDKCLLGVYFTDDFVTYTHSAPLAYSGIIQCNLDWISEKPNEFYASNSAILFKSRDGKTWTKFSGISGAGNGVISVMTPIGEILVTATYAYSQQLGLSWIYDVRNRTEEDYSGTPLPFKFKGQLYFWSETTGLIRRVRLPGLNPSVRQITGPNVQITCLDLLV